jgi:hypothetical protein
MSKAAVTCGLLFLLCFRVVSAPQDYQDYTARLNSLLEKVKNDLAERKPEWKHRSIEPIEGSRNVSVNNWEADGKIVRVSILAYGSSESAAESMRRFSSETRTLDRLPELGDGGYSWGLGGSNIGFRKGDVTVWVSSSVTNLKQAVKLSQEFAKLIDAAVPG